MWRISDDFWDTWPQLKSQFSLANSWMRFKKEGHWPNLDILPIGIIGSRSSNAGEGRRSRFTNDELQTMMTLWCMFRSPLFLGGDLLQLNEFEKRLIKNAQLLDIDQNSSNCIQLPVSDINVIIYVSEKPHTNTKYVAFFNLSDKNYTAKYPMSKLGFNRAVKVEDIWLKKELRSNNSSKDLSLQISPHGVTLLRISPF